MKNLAIIQARISSTRLPGKVLMELYEGKTALEIMILRIKNSRLVEKIIIATSIEKEDDAIEKECKKLGIEVFRGSLNNVLERFYLASIKYNPENIIRLTADCPLHEGKIIDDLIKFYELGKFDYANNCEKERTFPHGMDVEIFSFKILQEAYKNAIIPYDIEHVTPYIKKIATSKGLLQMKENFKHIRVTMDNKEDFNVIKNIINHFNNLNFTLNDIIELWKSNPKIFEENKHLRIFL